MSSGGLTDEQKKRIEENRRRALERRAARSTQSQQTASAVTNAEHGSNFYTSSSHRRPTAGGQSTSLSRLENTSVPKQQPHFKPRENHRNNIANSDGHALATSSSSSSASSCSTTSFQNKISKFCRPARSPAAATKNGNSSKSSSKSSPMCTRTLSFPLPCEPGAPQNSAKLPASSKMEKAVKGNCVLISRERFAVLVPYQAQLIGMFKTIPSRSYDAKTTKWDFSLSDYDKLMSAAKSLPPYITLEGLPKAVKSTFLKSTPGTLKDLSSHDINLNSVDGKLVQALMPFQKEGVSFGIRQNGRVLIADDMGLGKTVQAICVASYYRIEWPLLVIAPSSLRVTWQQAFMKWLPSVDPQSINVVLTGKDNPTEGLINIISYDLLSKRLDDIKQKQFRVIIADESHFIKNHKASRTKTALSLLKSASRVILLSGTPALSRPLELYTQICAIQPTLFPTFHQFGIRYCAGQQNRYGWDFSGASNMEELQLLLEEKLMIRRLKKDVLSQLPSKRRQMVLMDPSLIKTQTLERAAKQVSIAKQEEQRGALLNYFYETCAAKIPGVRNYILDLLESGRKFLVFAHHKNMLDAICKCLSQKKYCFIRIDGRTPASGRQALCDCFQQDKECLVAVLSITAANTGLTLTEASAVVFAELFWNPGALLQAEDRVYRIGQKNSVNIHYLVAKRTADDYLWPLIQTKLEVLGKAGLSEDELDADCTFFQDPKQQTLFSFVEYFMKESQDDVGATSNKLFDTGASSSPNRTGDVSSEAGCFYSETKPGEPNKLKSKSDSRKRTNPEDDNSPSTGNGVTLTLGDKFDWFDAVGDEDLIGCDLQEEKAGVEEHLKAEPSRKRRR